MSYRELFASHKGGFAGSKRTFDVARYVVVGVPFDATSTYRSGARFAPSAIREASFGLEGYCLRTGVDLKSLKLHDLGDLHVSCDVEETLGGLSKVVKELAEEGKIPVIIGGEHTATLGVAQGLRNSHSSTWEPTIVCFDAHLDLRDEYQGVKVSHATFLRRTIEDVNPRRVILLGTRAVCKEEVEFAEENHIEFLTADCIRREGTKWIGAHMKEKLRDDKSIYLSIDADVLDPSCAPAVQNPEPEGLWMHELLDIVADLCDPRVIGFDVVEVSPDFDFGVTAIHAARIVMTFLCSLEKSLTEDSPQSPLSKYS